MFSGIDVKSELLGVKCIIYFNFRLDIHTLPPAVSEVLGISERAYCREDWGYPKGR